MVVCSAAGVTRPSWQDAEKQRYPGSADIPIVGMNPFNILGVNTAGEETLRTSGREYCVLRPTGFNVEWPRGRPVASQGDMAAGRICRADVASLLVALSSE